MKTATLTIISFILLGACGQLANRAPVRMIQVGQDQLDRRVVQQIKEYYHLTYGEGTRLGESAEAADGEGTRLEESAVAAAIQMTYYNIPENDDEK